MRAQSKILVTGGTGFIGQHLLLRLQSKNCDLTVLDRTLKKLPFDSSNLTYFNSTVKEAVGAELIKLDSFDYIFHLAGNSSVQNSLSDPLADVESNVEQTICLLQALRGRDHIPIIIFPSSAAVYGEPRKMPIEEIDPTVPISPYGVSKLATEGYLAVFSRLFKMRSISLRPFSVYGPGQRKQVVYDIMRKLSDCPERIEVLGDGNQQRDFIYIDDLIDLMMLCCEVDLTAGQSKVFNAASGTSTTIRDLVQIIAEQMNVSPEVVFTGHARLGDPHAWSVNIDRAKDIGFSPKTSLDRGLTKILHWFVSEASLHIPI